MCFLQRRGVEKIGPSGPAGENREWRTPRPFFFFGGGGRFRGPDRFAHFFFEPQDVLQIAWGLRGWLGMLGGGGEFG